MLEIRWQGLRDLMRYDESLRQHIDHIYRERALAAHLRESTSLELARFVLRPDTYPAFERALAEL